ncbi:MAG: hypothetical protein R6U36_04400 [Candidatus Fermentibacteraceae bacterium]
MRRIALILLMALAIVLFGCGQEQGGEGEPGEAGEAVEGEAQEGEETGETAGGEMEDVAGEIFASPELEVGQWITYGVDQETEELTIGVLSEEDFQGTRCLWIQFATPEGAAQLLVDPVALSEAMGSYTGEAAVFFDDPAAYITENMPGGDMSAMFTDAENQQKMLDFVGALKMLRIDQGGGNILALDLSGVPEALAPFMEDSAMQEQLQAGMGPEQAEDMEEVMAKLEEMSFEAGETEVEIAGEMLPGNRFFISHPDGEAEIVFSAELPILPLAYARMMSVEDGEEHHIEVRGFGTDGVEDMLPGEPVQTMDAAMFIQMAASQGGQMQQQGGAGGSSAPIGGGM